jgi:hypothetical protein
MKKLISTFCFVFSTGVMFSASAQQWGGSATTANLLYRDGNVVVGGTSIIGSYGPGGRVFQVHGGDGAVMSLRATQPSTFFDISLGTGWLTMNTVNVPLYLSTNYAARVTVLTDGNVGIGTGLTSNPNGYKLAVNGKVGAKEVQVENTSSTWADYVFESDYKLMSLDELESFIQKNKHLPEIPSAEEVKVTGHKLGEMDVLLLKKVEELTLYIIEMKKEIEEVKRENAQLKSRGKK